MNLREEIYTDVQRTKERHLKALRELPNEEQTGKLIELCGKLLRKLPRTFVPNFWYRYLTKGHLSIQVTQADGNYNSDWIIDNATRVSFDDKAIVGELEAEANANAESEEERLRVTLHVKAKADPSDLQLMQNLGFLETRTTPASTYTAFSCH